MDEYDESEVLDETSLIGKSSSELAAYDGTLWNANNSVVNVCWTNLGWATVKAKIRASLQSTWGANSGLQLVFPANDATDLCPQAPPGSGTIASQYMPIYVVDSPGWWGNCQPGYGARMRRVEDCGGTVDCQCNVSGATADPHQMERVANVSVHEIGHGLGLPHEHIRSDRPSDIVATCVDSTNDNNKWATNSNYIVNDTLRRLTTYDGLRSIMSYCRDVNEDGAPDAPPLPGFAEISDLDKLGIEMLYPFSLGRKPVLEGVSNASGSEHVVRSDVSTQLRIDWVQRGGLTTTLSNIRWRDGSTGAIISTAASPSLAITATRVIQVELDDTLGRHHPWTGTTAIPSNSRHTAVHSSTYLLLL